MASAAVARLHGPRRAADVDLLPCWSYCDIPARGRRPRALRASVSPSYAWQAWPSSSSRRSGIGFFKRADRSWVTATSRY